METTKILIGYGIYLPVALFLTYYVSKTLFKNGKIFMLDIFKGREEIAEATNKLFETGFYLLNIGFALMILELKLNKDLSLIHISEPTRLELEYRFACEGW